MLKKFKTAIYILLVILTMGYIFLNAPNLNPLYPDGAILWATIITVFVGAWALMKFGEITFKGFKTVQQGEKPQNPFGYNSRKKFPKWVKFVLVTPWILIVIAYIGSSVFFNWKGFRDQLGEPVVKKFTSEVQAIDVSQVPVVDKELAYNLATKKLGERLSLGSQTTPGEPTIQMVDGKLVWVVPLHHSGFFKWLFNMQGTPGYVVVSATNINNVKYVEGHKIKYHPNSYLLNDLQRHVRFTKGLFEGITDYSFELDDTGKPYWVVSTYKNTRGFALPEATGVIVVDATTGATEKYTIDTVPEWVDRVQPEDFIVNQINNRGKYVRGIFNFSNRDKYESSRGHNIVYNNGNNYLFTGITSVGADESAMGFVMVDMVTKQSIQYQMSGATEAAAMRSAQGKVQDLGYYATFPIILNISDTPTYFMTLKDNEKLIKEYAFVSIQNYNTVGVGETMNDAIKNYVKSLKNSGVSSNINKNVSDIKTVTGKVVRIAPEINQDNTVYKLILDNSKDVIFVAEAGTSEQLALTLPNDNVEISYTDTNGNVKMVSSFKNNSIGKDSIVEKAKAEETTDKVTDDVNNIVENAD